VGILVVVFAGVFAATKWTARDAPGWLSSRANPVERDWEHHRWLDKTARLLRGEGLGRGDDTEALLKMTREEAARHFMKDPRFGDAILDFNLFFLGFKIDVLKSDGAYDRTAFDFPNAVTSAQAMLKGGDYLALFDLEASSYFMPPLRTAPVDDPPLDANDAGLTAAQVRHKAVGEMWNEFQKLVAFAVETPAEKVFDLCSRIMAMTLQADFWHGRVIRAFDDNEAFGLTRGRAIVGPLDTLGFTTFQECWGKGQQPSRATLQAAIQLALDRFDRTFEEVQQFEPSRYKPQSVAEFRPFDLTAFADTKNWIAFGYEQGLALANSSTNTNRRRSAYMLKRFFCDDLTPVGVETPTMHVTGPLGAASCQTCHYKLDPMAGFFRNHGVYFMDFSQHSHMTFDDLATAERQKYQSAWQSPPGAGRPWNVGYIRSTANESLNSYGESLSDLSRIIRSAPEARQCLMRRLVEYAVADQAIDGGWLAWLTSKFESESIRNSSEAMKNAIVRVVTSKVFMERNADPGHCYDFGPTGRNENAPPCRIAFVLEKNCARCHDSLRTGSGRIDLTSWKKQPDSDAHGFPHLDASGKQFPREESLARIVSRITTNDPDLRMPRGISMSSQDRQELFRWANEELARKDQLKGVK
jgi:hypothetical protein